jgi:hypothetical protein
MVWLLTACAIPQPGLVISPAGPTATTARSVAVEDLAANMENYADQLVRIEGEDGSFLVALACAGIFPADQWIVFSRLPGEVKLPTSAVVVSYDLPPRVNVRGLRPAALSVVPFKHVVVTGWVRLYEGPRGCYSYDRNDRTETPPPAIREWYIEAVDVQCPECETIPTPAPPMFVATRTPRPSMVLTSTHVVR